MLRTRCHYSIFLGAILSALFSCNAVSSQTDSGARKFDEFGDIEASDLIARLDNLAIQLQNEPNKKAFLVVYRTRRDLPGLSNRYAQRMKGYMAGSRGVSADRIITVDGGVAPCLTQELWIVSPGSAPQPRSEAWTNYYKPSVYKFDEHSYGYREVYYWQDSFDELLEAFGVELQKNPKSLGYLIAYRNPVRHTPQVMQNLLRSERNFLIKQFGIKPARLKLISGGNREWTTIELWIAEEPGAFPIITWYRSARIFRRR